MKSLINLKRDVIYKLAEKYKFYDEDIDIKEIETSYRHGYVSVEWRHEKDDENADTRENLFSFNDFIKDNK